MGKHLARHVRVFSSTIPRTRQAPRPARHERRNRRRLPTRQHQHALGKYLARRHSACPSTKLAKSNMRATMRHLHCCAPPPSAHRSPCSQRLPRTAPRPRRHDRQAALQVHASPCPPTALLLWPLGRLSQPQAAPRPRAPSSHAAAPPPPCAEAAGAPQPGAMPANAPNCRLAIGEFRSAAPP